MKIITTKEVTPISNELLFTQKHDLGKLKSEDHMIF